MSLFGARSDNYVPFGTGYDGVGQLGMAAMTLVPSERIGEMRPKMFPSGSRRYAIRPIEGMSSGAFPGATPAQRLASADAYLSKALGEGALINDANAAPPPAAAAPAAAAPAAAAPKLSDDALLNKYRKGAKK